MPKQRYRMLKSWEIRRIGEEIILEYEPWRWNDYCKFYNEKNPERRKQNALERIEKKNKKPAKKPNN